MKRALLALAVAALLAGCGNYAQRNCKKQCRNEYGPGSIREACQIACWWDHRGGSAQWSWPP